MQPVFGGVGAETQHPFEVCHFTQRASSMDMVQSDVGGLEQRGCLGGEIELIRG